MTQYEVTTISGDITTSIYASANENGERIKNAYMEAAERGGKIIAAHTTECLYPDAAGNLVPASNLHLVAELPEPIKDPTEGLKRTFQ